MYTKRNKVTNLGVILFTLLIAMLFTGIAYGTWMDESKISGTVEIGTWDFALLSSGCSPYEGSSFSSLSLTGAPTYVSSNITDSIVEIGIINAQSGVEYRCSFVIVNTGTVPVKIQALDIPGLPAELTTRVTGFGVIIDPGQTQSAAVQAQLTDSNGAGMDFNFTAAIVATVWNQP